MKRTRLVTSLLFAATLWLGCDSPTGGPDLETSRKGLLSVDTTTLEKQRREGERLLAVGPRGASLFGTPDEALPHTDQPLLFEARHVDASGKTTPLPEGLGKIAEAHMLPGGDSVLFLTEDHRLTRWSGEALEVLDEDVQGPVSVSPSGKLLAYLKGEDPIYSVVSRELSTNKVSNPGGDIQGCWSPAIGDDGDVVFMASASGYAELYLAKQGRAPQQITTRESGQTIAVPTGPSAPLLVDDDLFFEDQRGLHHIDLAKQDALSSRLLAPNLRELVWRSEGTHVLGQRDGKLEVRALAASGGEQ